MTFLKSPDSLTHPV